MSSNLAETGGLETKTEETEPLPDLRSVPDFDEDSIRNRLVDYLDTEEDDDERVVFLVRALETLPSYLPDLCEELAASQEEEVLEVANVIIPEAISRAVAAQVFDYADLDRMRDAWGSLLGNKYVRPETLKGFRANFKSREQDLKTMDSVTYSRIGWIATARELTGFSRDFENSRSSYEKSREIRAQVRYS